MPVVVGIGKQNGISLNIQGPLEKVDKPLTYVLDLAARRHDTDPELHSTRHMLSNGIADCFLHLARNTDIRLGPDERYGPLSSLSSQAPCEHLNVAASFPHHPA